MSVSEITHPLALVNRIILIGVRSDALCCLSPLGHSQRLMNTESLKQLVSSEVTCMHSVHVAHFNALADGLSRYAPSDKSLHADD